MILYPLNLFSMLLLGVVYGLLILAWLGLRGLIRGMPARRVLLAVAGAVFLILPIAEEIWVAWNFGRLCDHAGLSVNKTVTVDGFYDDTHSWSERRMNEAHYRFVEGRGISEGKNTYWRHERVGTEVRSFRIEKPSARYQYRMPHSHSPVAHKIAMFEYVVVDTQTGEVLAQDRTYARNPYWFFFGSQQATRFCPVSGADGEKRITSLYNLVLMPSRS